MFRTARLARAAPGMAVALTRLTGASVLRPVSQAGHAGSCAALLNQSALAARNHSPECPQTTVFNATNAAVAVAGVLAASALAVVATAADTAASMPPRKRKMGSARPG